MPLITQSDPLHAALTRLRDAYTGLLSVRSVDTVTPAEMALGDAWQSDLEPVLADLYWSSLRNGLDSLPTDDDELRAALTAHYDNPRRVAVLLLLLRRYQARAVNLGGNMGLDALGLDGTFRLTNADYLGALDDHAAMLTTVDSDMSLVDTTIDQLATGIPMAREDDNPIEALGLLIGGWALQRSATIAVTEETRAVANGLSLTYGENGVAMQEFITRLDEKVCPICSPLHGRTMPVDNIPSELRLPVHSRCRCSYAPVLDNWTPPTQIWRGD